MIHDRVQALLDEIRENSFIEGYIASDEQCMGLLLSKYFGFNGTAILKVTYYGLEDSNFHKENETIWALLKRNGARI